MGKPLKVHFISETSFGVKANGVHTAFLNLIDLLKEGNDVEVVVNNDGHGDVLHSHTYGPYYFWKGIRYRGKKIFTSHIIPDSIDGSLPGAKYLKPFLVLYLKMVYRYADVVISISPMVEKAIKELSTKTKVVNIYNPVLLEEWTRTTDRRTAGRKTLGLSENDFVVIGVGQLQARKGVEDFIDVAQAIPNAKFVWVGGRPMGALLTEGVERIDNRIAHASENIQFTGMVDIEKMPEMFAAADLMLFTSYQENSPLAPIEGAASGLPVIFRDIAEYTLLYTHPYLKAKTTEEFIEKTKELMENKTAYSAGVVASGTLIQQFEKSYIRKQLVDLYKSLVES